MQKRLITLLITGTVLTAGLIIGFGGYVFAGDPVPGLHITIEQIPGGRVSTKSYDSSFSKKSPGLVRKEVGDVLLGYGVGGADINKVTDALEGGGVYEAELESFLIAIGINDEATSGAGGGAGAGKVKAILSEFDKLGIGINKEPNAGDAAQGSQVIECKTDAQCHKGEICAKGMCLVIKPLPPPALSPPAATLIPAVQKAREIARLQKSAETLSQDLRANAQDLRDNFRERSVREVTDKIEKLEIARIAVAHGKGLRMVNRYRSAIARFDHILGRLESRVQKLETQVPAKENVKTEFSFPSAILLLEEAKNMQVENEAKLVELQAKYESLLTGENPQRIAEEARAIAKELKSAIENLHAKLREIATAMGGYIKIQGIK